ncbi:hypothetical protein DFH11DRAFT_129947 [Phellopilus nigrolimitatus]|nr:hypothetical protein DFH11DRAFT_129947 [Phellopilus nigrolimitatus]
MAAHRKTSEADEQHNRRVIRLQDKHGHPVSSFSSSSTWRRLKRKPYSHWDDRLLKNDVVVQVRNGENISAKPKETPRFHISALSARSSRPSPQNTTSSHAYIDNLFPRQPFAFTSFSLPHLPPATYFPPFAHYVRLNPEAKDHPALSPLLEMVTSSGGLSTILCLARPHKPLQSPTFWKSRSEANAHDSIDELRYDVAKEDADEVHSFFTVVGVSEKDKGDAVSNAEQWPEIGGTQYVAGPVEMAFEDSFIGPFPASFSNSSDAQQKITHTSPLINSECTCGHRRHFVRTLSSADATQEGPDSDEEHDAGYETCDEYGDCDEYPFRNDGEHAVFDDALSEQGEYGTPMRAVANLSSVSLGLTLDSRTSSAMYLSPNFIRSDSEHDISPFPVHSSAPASIPSSYPRYEIAPSPAHSSASLLSPRSKSRSTASEPSDGHRGYFPTTAPLPLRSPSKLHRFLGATRKRIASFNRAGREQTRHMRRASLSDIVEPCDEQTAGTTPHESVFPSAARNVARSRHGKRKGRGREERSREGRGRERRDRKKRVRSGRGRSTTPRPLPRFSSTSALLSLDTIRPQERTQAEFESGRNAESVQPTSPEKTRFSFMRRLSMQFGRSNGGKKAATAPASPSSPPLHVPNRGYESSPVRTRASVTSELRNFKVANLWSPKRNRTHGQTDA